MSGPSTPADVDALFKLPPEEFTAARNALVAQLKRDGRHAEASEAKALTKPSVSAWVVNQLYWRRRESFDRLIEAGDRLRRAHAVQRTGDSARDPVSVRRELVAELASIAADLLREAGHGGTRDLSRRVATTLEALSSYGRRHGAPAAGRLSDDLQPPGFEAALGMRLPGAEPPTKRPSRAHQRGAAARHAEGDRKPLVAATKAAVRGAEQALKAARKQAERAATTLETAAARTRAIEGERARIEKRLARLSKDAEAAHSAARDATANADRATQAAKDAERALELARARVKEIGNSRG